MVQLAMSERKEAGDPEGAEAVLGAVKYAPAGSFSTWSPA